MRTEAAVRRYWQDVAQQNEEALREYFTPNARIRWQNTDEQFTVDGFSFTGHLRNLFLQALYHC